MQNNEYAAAFIENERTANQYAIRMMRVLALVVGIVWLLNIVGIFIVPAVIMGIAAGGALVLFLLPSLLGRLVDLSLPKVKYYILGCCVLSITLLSSAMPKHAILAWMAPVLLSCHYYSKKLNYGTAIVSAICMSVSLIIGTYYGEWDNNLIKAVEVIGEPRVITGDILQDVFIFYILPRVMSMLGMNVLCTSLSERTHKLLRRHARDSAVKHQIESELNVARQIQTSMLPSIFPTFSRQREFDIFASMTPAKEVGGDFYDFFMVDDTHLAVVIADVSGKGMPAALFMVIGKTLIKDHMQTGKDLGDVFTKVNELLCESNSEGLFITVFAGVLDVETGEFRYVNAGHNPPLIRRKNGQFEYLKVKSGFVLAGFDEMLYREQSLRLERGDELFLYTDGVTEATDANTQLYGEERLAKTLNDMGTATSEQLCAAVKTNVDSFVGEAPQFDDITMLSLQYRKCT